MVIYFPSGGTWNPLILVLIINHLDLLFGTQEGPRRLKPFPPCNSEMGESSNREFFELGKALWGLAWLQLFL